MNPTLAQEIERMANLGWQVRTQTDSTAALEDRSPFGWIWFALSLLVFFGLGGILYVGFWLLTSREHIFLRMEGDSVVHSGDVWLLRDQERDAEQGKQLQMDIKRKGFLAVMWPSIVTGLAMMAIWFLVIWLFVSRID